MGEELAADIEDLGDHARGNLALGDLDRRLDHRQRETLDAEAIMAKIAFLGLQQPLGNLRSFGEIGKKPGEMRFRQSVILFVLPECIVGIEADRRQWSRRHMRTS